MNLARMGHAPHAGAAAEAEALIEEARARARRRRRRIAMVVVCVAALAAGTLAAAGGFPGTRPAAGARKNGPAGAVADVAGPPRYFVDARGGGSGYGWLEIRESASGKLVAQPGQQPPDYLPPYGLAATGPRSFVAGMMTPSDCATRFFRFQLDDRGRPGALTPVGPTLPGELTAMAASAGGGLIGYAIDDSGCKTGGTSPGAYLGVLDVHSGQTRQWTHASSLAQLRVLQLSMSANGRLLAFSQVTGLPMNGGTKITGMQVRVLPTDAPPGTVAQRSRVVARTSLDDPLIPDGAAVLLSPSGTSFYLCSQASPLPRPGASQIVETARITAYQTATGKATGVIAGFTASFTPNPDGTDPLTVGCSSMALDTSGRFLLVPYQETPANPGIYGADGSVSVAEVNTATDAKSTWTLQFSDGEAPGEIPDLMGIENVAW